VVAWESGRLREARQRVQAVPPAPRQESLGEPSPGHPLLQLQRTLGNQGVLRRLGVVQRDADPTADNVKAAVALLKDVSPISIHQCLSAVQLGAGSATVSTVAETSGGTATTSTFTLELKVGALTGHSIAEFQGVSPVKPGGATRTYAMTITIGPAAASMPPQTLASHLYHEGLHMRLFMDRAAPGSSSVHLFRMESYLALARKSASHAPLLSDLAAYMQKNGTGKSLKTAQTEANDLVEHMMEEKYIMDETVRSGLTPKVQQTPSDLSRNYQTLTTRWLVTYLQKYGVSTGDPATIGTLAGRLRAIWMEIDAEQQRLAQIPVLVPRSSGPPYLPPEPS